MFMDLGNAPRVVLTCRGISAGLVAASAMSVSASPAGTGGGGNVCKATVSNVGAVTLGRASEHSMAWNDRATGILVSKMSLGVAGLVTVDGGVEIGPCLDASSVIGSHLGS